MQRVPAGEVTDSAVAEDPVRLAHHRPWIGHVFVARLEGGQENPPIPRDDLDRWDRVFERPDADELADYDASVVITD